MSNSGLTDEMFEKRVTEDRALPENLRAESINDRWNRLTPEERERLVAHQQIELLKIRAPHETVKRPRVIGPVDRAVRRMEEHYRKSH